MPPRRAEDARKRAAAGGAPPEPGLYAWWLADRGALPDVPLAAVEGRPEWLLYVGIAPSRPGSRQTLRGRICGNHLRGNITGSTFRLSLAALLWQQEEWALRRRNNRVLLAPEANAALTAWQAEHLRVSWSTNARPWDIEQQVIKALARVRQFGA